MVWLTLLLVSSAAVAQNLSMFKMLSDSVYLTDAKYHALNKYQKDATIFMDMVADTHPYYVKAERRAEWMAKKPALIEQCTSIETDEAFADALIAVLGPLHDKHTDVTTPKRLQVQRDSARKEALSSGAGVADKAHIMRPHASHYDYQIFPDASICYLQFNKCEDAADFPFYNFLDKMFADMEAGGIRTLVVDVQYNNGGSSRLCDQLFMHLYPLDKMKFFTSYLRFSDLMAAYNPRMAEAKKKWEDDGHKDELYQMPAPKIPANFQQPELYKGQVVFVMGKRTFSSAGMLLTNARDHHVGTIIGSTSTFSPSHYGEVLPFRLPNTEIIGSISTKYFARPDATAVDERYLRPDMEIDLEDKDAAWSYIVRKYGASSHHALVDSSGHNPGWLWEISGNGLQQKSYLFGTCHGEGHNFTREELLGISGLDDALNDVKAVLFEGGMNTEISKADSAAIISELQNTMKKLTHPGAEYMMPEGTYYKPLFDTVAHFNEVNKFLYYKMKDPEYWKKNPRYWLARMRLYMAFGMRRGTPLDVILKQETVKRGIESRYVEERDEIGNKLFSEIFDTSVIDTLSMKEQVKSLYSIVHHVINNDSVNSFFQAFANVYLQNDTCMMWQYLNKAGFVAGAESEDDDHHEIQYDRNVKWIPVIKENITVSPCMVAVGCRHLMGSESLIALLRREGYTVEPFKKQ